MIILKKVKIGLIGLGSMGSVHLSNCIKMKNVEVIAVADKSKRALIYAKNIGIKNIYTNYEEIIKDKNIDALIISLPNFLHKDCAIAAAEAGKHIFIEKPLARNILEGEEICTSIEHSDVKGMVGYPLRFDKRYIDLKADIENGIFGAVITASTSNISSGPFSSRGQLGRPVPVPSWWFDKELLGGGALLDLGVHSVNLFRYYFGDVIETHSQLGYRFNMDLEDHAVCIMKFKSGTLATIKVGWFSSDIIRSLEINGTIKNISFIQSSPSKLKIISSDIKKKLGLTNEYNSFYHEINYFIDCLNLGIQPIPSVDEGLMDLKIISEAYNNQLGKNSNALIRD